MARKIAQGSYLFLVLYGLIYTVFFNVPTTFLSQVLSGEAEAFTGMVFNFLGLIPLAFLLYFLRFHVLKWYHFVILLLSFGLGGFSLGLMFFVFPERRHPEKPFRIAAILGLTLSVFTLFMGLTGSVSAFLELFINDSFVHVMTIDFFILWIFYLTLPAFAASRWKAAFVIGMFYQLVDKPQ